MIDNEKIILGVLVLVVGGSVAWRYGGGSHEVSVPESVGVAGKMINFSLQKKSAHFETSTPSHGDVLPAVPVAVVVDVNFDLGPGTKIQITHDGQEYGVGETMIDANLLAARRSFDGNAPDGLYSVDYSACWPDGSCHKGHFEFVIDRTMAASYEDMTGKKSVEIALEGGMFAAKNIRISRGTQIRWVNKDDAVHYVNTDSHPAHTYYPAQNSKALKQRQSYGFTFNEVGFYPYHCSAHAATMTANIIVE